MLSDIKIVEDVHRLAGDEDVQKWQSAIANQAINQLLTNQSALPGNHCFGVYLQIKGVGV